MTDRPFDARKSWLCERDEPPQGWRTVSLVTAVRALVEFNGHPSSESHETVLKGCLDSLTQRGIDADSLLRYGLFPELLSPLIFHYAIGPALGPEERQDLDADLARRGLDTTSWDAILPPRRASTRSDGLEAGPGGSTSGRPAFQDMAPALAWVLVAPRDALLTLRAPTEAELGEALKQTPPDSAVLEQYRWIVDRFSTTRLADWFDPSLHLELRYQLDDVPSPCDERLMPDRVVDMAELNAEIAKRAIAPARSRQLRYSVLAAQMQGKAQDFLAAGRRREAAALFEFALSQSPDDRDALNNLGFCLVVDEPDAALQHLRHARSLGYTPLGINVYNEAFVLRRQGQARVALQVVEDNWDAINAAGPAAAVLWQVSAGGAYELTHVPDVRTALLELCVDLAQLQGGAVAQRWSERTAG